MKIKRKTVSIVAFVCAIIVELVAMLLFLVPVSGFFIYPCVCFFAIGLSLLSGITASHSKVFRTIAFIVSAILICTVIVEVGSIIRFVLVEML